MTETQNTHLQSEGRHVLFLLGSARQGGNSEALARAAAEGLPDGTQQTWLWLRDYALPPFEDLRHTPQSYGEPVGHARTLLQAVRQASDIVLVSPLYWYSVSSDMQRFLDEWSAWLRLETLDGEPVSFRAEMGQKRFWAVMSAGNPVGAGNAIGMLEQCAGFFGTSLSGHVVGSGSKPADVSQRPEDMAAARALFVGGTD